MRFLVIFCHFRRAIPVSPDSEIIVVGRKSGAAFSVTNEGETRSAADLPHITPSARTPDPTYKSPGDKRSGYRGGRGPARSRFLERLLKPCAQEAAAPHSTDRLPVSRLRAIASTRDECCLGERVVCFARGGEFLARRVTPTLGKKIIEQLRVVADDRAALPCVLSAWPKRKEHPGL